MILKKIIILTFLLLASLNLHAFSSLGLIWQDEAYTNDEKKAFEKNMTNIKTQNYNGAIEYCEKLNYIGYDDWFLPSSSQLQELSKRASYLKNNINKTFWSSTKSKNVKENAIFVNFDDSLGYDFPKSSISYVRCARKIKNGDTNSQWQKLGNIEDTNFKEGYADFYIKFNKHGAVLNPKNTKELVYMGKDCDAYSKLRGKGKWNFFKQNIGGFWISFDDKSRIETHPYGNNIFVNMFENMPSDVSKCEYVREEISIVSNDCTSTMTYSDISASSLKDDLSKYGWELLDGEEYCSGTGLGFCSYFAKDCKGRRLQVVTVGETEPSIDSIFLVK